MQYFIHLNKKLSYSLVYFFRKSNWAPKKRICKWKILHIVK